MFEHICETLWGWGWQSALSRELNVNSRTVRRWKAQGHVPEGIYDRLESIRQEKLKALAALEVMPSGYCINRSNEDRDVPTPPPPPPLRMISEYGGVVNQHEIDAWNAKYGKDSKCP